MFCGKIAENKNNEHIIPRFLIEMTGDLKRDGNFGFDLTSNNPVLRKYTFDQFKFPACYNCNLEDSNLEGEIKNIIDNILNEKNLTENNINTLLNWFDKVRVGLWLSFRYLNKDRSNINPRFHIKQRMQENDRSLIIYKIKEIEKGINFLGSDGLGFDYNPTCFALRINNYIFLNISSVLLLSENLGYPYAQKTELSENNLYERNNLIAHIVDGNNCVEKTIFNGIPKNYVAFHQSIYKNAFNEKLIKYYNNDYVKNNSLDYKNGIGNIFIENNNIEKYNGNIDFKNLIEIDNYNKLFSDLINWVYDFQLYDYTRHDYSLLNESLRDSIDMHRQEILAYNLVLKSISALQL